MKQINNIFLIVLFLTVFSSFGMNVDYAEDDILFYKPLLTVRDFNGKIFSLHTTSARKSEYIKGALRFKTDKIKDLGDVVKEGSFDGIDFIEVIPVLPDLDFYKEPIDTKTFDTIEPTAKIIKMVVNCANQMGPKSIKTKHLKAVMALADYFQIPKEGNQYIASQLEECANDDPAISKYMLEYGGNSLVSLKEAIIPSRMIRLYNPTDNKDQCSIHRAADRRVRILYGHLLPMGPIINDPAIYNGPPYQDVFVLWLADKKLQTLYGINAYKEINAQYEEANLLHYQLTITEFVNISGNELIKLDVDALLKVFPKLKCLYAYNNPKMKTLIMPKKLPDGFVLVLNNNPIEYISPFKAGQEGILSFSKGCLSKEAINVLEQSIQPNVYEKRMHYPFFAKRIALAAGLGFALGGFCGLGTFGPQSSTGSSRSNNFSLELLLRGTAYCFVKGLQWRGHVFDEDMKKDIANTEFLAKLLAVGGMITIPIVFKFLPNFNFTIPIWQKDISLNMYGGYPVYKPSKIVLS